MEPLEGWTAESEFFHEETVGGTGERAGKDEGSDELLAVFQLKNHCRTFIAEGGKMKFAMLGAVILFASFLSPQTHADAVVNGDFSDGNSGFTSGYTFAQADPPNVGVTTQLTQIPPISIQPWEVFPTTPPEQARC